MTSHARERGIPYSALGILFGAALGACTYAVVVLVLNLDLLVGAESAPLADIVWPTWMLPWFLMPGICLGLLAFVTTSRVSHEERVRSSIFSLLALVGGASLGAIVAGISYMILRTASSPEPALDTVGAMATAMRDPQDLMRVFLLGGSLAGVLAALYLRGGLVLRSIARFGAGVAIGTVAGIIIYVFAYVLINYPKIPDSSIYVLHFAEAVYSFSPIEFAFAALGAVVGGMMARYSWRLYGIFALTSLLAVVLGYLLYSVTETLPQVPMARKPFALILFAAEAVSLTMVVLYSFYTIDVATRKRWNREPKANKFSKYFLPKVAFHVPTYNEPPQLVIDSLRSLIALDYPRDRFVVMVGDDSTDPGCSQPLKDFCETHEITYVHRTDRRGYKAGALNGLLNATPDDVELIAVIDADYQVQPEFLQETAGYFIDPELAWLQTPQDYRNEDESFLTKQYYLADKYFYRTILPSRNEENSIIFCGTMGILRRQALVESGGWGETYITEDAELSVRLLASGWRSLYVNKTYGRGLIPSTFAGYKRQHHRWAFGGGQVVRGHFADIFLGRLTGRQRFDYLVGNMHWFEGLFLLVIALSILAMGIGELAGFNISSHHANEIMLVGLVPWLLLVDGFTRLHMVLKRNLRLGFGGTIRVLGMWMAVKFSNSFAALQGVLGFKMAFVRTPKETGGRARFVQALNRAVRTTPFESSLALLMLLVGIAVTANTWLDHRAFGSVAVAQWLLSCWLVYYALVFAAAPIYAYKSCAAAFVRPAPVSLSKRIPSVAQ